MLIMNLLLVAGLVFLTISWLSVIASTWGYWRNGRRSSAAYVPFVGPIILTCWVVLDSRPLWLIAIVWLLDIGTVVFLLVAPVLLKEWWQTSRVTNTLTLRGIQGIESATLTLHSGGRYLLRKVWNRPKDMPGIVGLGEPGTYIEDGSDFQLTAHYGLRRHLYLIDSRTTHASFSVREEHSQNQDDQHYSLDGWTLSA
jgi:hypothetical protein